MIRGQKGELIGYTLRKSVDSIESYAINEFGGANLMMCDYMTYVLEDLEKNQCTGLNSHFK